MKKVILKYIKSTPVVEWYIIVIWFMVRYAKILIFNQIKRKLI